MSFATSQPLAEYPASPPTGALSSNSVYTTSLCDAGAGNVTWDFPLPDLAAQVQEFLALSSASSKKGAPREIIFALSFGFWDIFHFASLDYELAKTMVDAAVDELVHQIDILYSSYTPRRVDPEPQPPSDNESDSELLRPAAFRIAIPKLFDPSLVPGWLTQRSLSLFPTTVAEEQKHAFYLTERWNSRLENSLGSWVAEPESQEEKAPEEESAADAEAQKEAVVAEDGDEPKQTPSPPAIPKDVFFYDLPRYILDIIIEQHLQDEGLSDAEGLGKGETPFENVSQPCVDFSSEEDRDKDGRMTARKEFHGKTICADPKGHLFWDAFNIGAVANEGLGRGIAQMIREGAMLQYLPESLSHFSTTPHPAFHHSNAFSYNSTNN